MDISSVDEQYTDKSLPFLASEPQGRAFECGRLGYLCDSRWNMMVNEPCIYPGFPVHKHRDLN